ncbi:ATP-binding protein [bacterium]|nr:MAG: ATP-binding protein [bacterium]
MRFIGRRIELEALERIAGRQGGQMVLVYGRRRVGKSYLLERFSRERHALYYQATQQAEAVELAAFSELARSLTGLPAGVAFPGWEAALDAVAAASKGRRLVVILDEFPYLCDSTTGLPSIVQRWWDHRGRTSGVMLILCGSAQTFMEELEAHAAPLFGRFTGKLPIRPLSYREAAEFTPTLSTTEKALTFGILGGTPFNLDQWDTALGVRDNLLGLFGDPMSSLIDSAEHILTSDLPDPRVAYRVLQAIALGHSRWTDIRDYAKVHDRVLPRLIEIGLIERRTPATEDPAKSRRSVYRIPDPYLRFWFRFIARNRGAIERGLGQSVIDEQVMPFLDQHMGQTFEDMAREFVLDLVRRRALRADDVGFWQSPDGQHEIDIVGVVRRKPTFIGTVKWRQAPLDAGVLLNLETHARALGVGTELPWLLIGRGGVDRAILTRSTLHGYSVADLYETE